MNRVFLHVGSPKTGTTFLQQVLWSQRDLAREQGLLLPMRGFVDHYRASLDVRHVAARHGEQERAEGIWQAFVRESLAWDGTVLISHELFAGATEEQARAAIEAFGQDAEVHVVLTARDLARQIPAEWQEHVKHKATDTFPEFVERIQRPGARKSWFWQVQDVADVVRRWGMDLPRERVHVVTVPPRGSAPELLWGRFAGLLGLDPAAFDLTGSRSNVSLGAEQVELLRRVNERLGDDLPMPGPYTVDVKDVYAQQILAARTGARFGLDGDSLDFAVRRSEELVAELEKLEVQVVGSLDDLVPRRKDQATPTVDIADSVLLEEAVSSLAGLLVAYHERRTERDEARRELRRRGPSRVRYRQRAKELAVRASERSAAVMRLRRVYRRYRDRAPG